MPLPNNYVILSPDCHLKQLEELYVYNVATDDLYETNEQGFEFLKLCDGSHKINELEFEQPFFDWCREEGLLTLSHTSTKRNFSINQAPKPSLRYLELQITARCNLKCLHCYLGSAKPIDLPVKQFRKTLEEFQSMQGLRLLLSGGEPLLHQDFWQLNEMLPDYEFRSVLLTNGTLIDSNTASKLKIHEAQVSLDGMEVSHDALRGKGSFARALQAMKILHANGKDVSVATMVHARNLQDFPEMKSLIESLQIKEWNIDVPCSSGNMSIHKEFQVSYSEAAPFLEYAFGGGLYTSSPGYACGSHLCTVTPEGLVAKCGFFSEQPVGHINEGLHTCWDRIKHLKLEELKCRCDYLEECRGGCRYRAFLNKDIYAPDPVQCYLRGISYQ